MEKYKILFLHAGAELYGADKILLEIVDNIDRKTFEPIVILPEDGPLVSKMREAGVEVSVLPYPILRRKFFNIRGIGNYIFSYIRFSRRLKKIVNKENIRLVHVNTTAVLEGVWLKLFTKAKIVWHVHEIIMKPKFIYKMICFLIQHFSDQTVAVSDATKQRLIDSGIVDQAKVITIHNGISRDYSQSAPDYVRKLLNIPSDAIVIGMIGRVNAWKGQSDFIDAVCPILQRNQNVHVLLVGSAYVGEEEYEKRLVNKVASLATRERIHLCPFTEKIADYYAALNIFVLPSIQPDPFPTVVLEAMSNSLPVVAYNHGGASEMILDNETGYLCPPLDVTKLTQKLDLLVGNTSLRLKMGQKANIRQEKFFSLSQFVERITQVYVDLIS
ncbi:glycosyltransferase family 4 protein [Lacticaseibacillus paracasei]|uniref:glycosyltransferase family 4 protein n=1 Tax=Lacticaseibacillus paracasei TaxID=1597 RepID=UPI0021A96EC1|nr:glycosyltransferase family 4 protein [Lacticaseibacillus paracasei]MCT3377998.1 glycosyltransferase family 1 protein [Lacticaseibacillus paracasei]QHV91378.1 glycosyl transferase [Lacticaseibacillus paracasei]